MAEFNLDKLVAEVLAKLVWLKSDDCIKAAFEEICNSLDLDGAFLLRANEIPLLLDVKCMWERERRMSGKRILLDYTEKPDWDVIKSGKETTCFSVSDISGKTFGSVSDDFLEALEIKAFTAVGMRSDEEFQGLAVYVCHQLHEWSDDEKVFLRKITAYISKVVEHMREEEVHQYMLHEAERTISEAYESRNRFISNLSHEVRTPVNAVIGLISIMRHNLESTEVMSECIDRMEKSSKQLMDIISDCVDMTVMNSSEMSLNSTWVPLESLVGGVCKIIDPLAEGRNLQLDFDYDPSITILGDEVKLGRILINVLSNSCKWTEEGSSVMVSISREKTAIMQDAVKFRIHDETIGIGEETAKHIFEPMYVFTTESGTRNTGLNMTITKHLVELLNGTIEFSSDGWGSELTITIPMETRGGDSEAVTEDNRNAIDAEIAEIYIGRRVLVAEDNVLMSEIISTILGYRGLETDSAVNGQEAFDKFAGHDPFYYDMILMDVQMPVMGGIEATEAIRGCDRADAGIIPIVALSANAYEEDMKKAMAAGMNAYLKKPVGEKELFETISNFVF